MPLASNDSNKFSYLGLQNSMLQTESLTNLFKNSASQNETAAIVSPVFLLQLLILKIRPKTKP